MNYSMRDVGTRIHRLSSETGLLHVSLGQHVEISVGNMEGCKGIAVEQRAAGRILVRLGGSLNFEVHQFCLQPVEIKEGAGAPPEQATG